MRLAISGTHGVGKTTLAEDLVAARPDHEAVAEPYWEMTAAGAVFSDPPTVEDMAEQLAESVRTILAAAGERDVVFDRSPLDFLAYIDCLPGGEDWEPSGRLLVSIEAALSVLEVIVFVPLEVPDAVAGPVEHPRLRRAVDRRLRRILLEDELGLLAGGPPVVEVAGSRRARLAQVLATIDRG